ncbi:adhesion G protein-coupled receptor L2-like [Mya arenaria]|uniref:adhesion G protein-coupled receptor L2-like n=1 Tax=Mya arenaria TaxID=6604 RepID=UPI0022E25AF3|nr:adhesion G protein-coupled receptor L2-like [Mya arenaria]
MDLKNLWILHLVIILKEASSEEEVICREPWTRIHRSCIFFNTTLTNQSEAAAGCDTMGGYLLVFSNVQEHEGVKNETRRIFLELRSTKYLEWWVGLEFDSKTKTWNWVSDEEFNKKLTEWAPGWPNKDKCAAFNYKWSLKDNNCTMERPFICEQNRTVLTSTTAPTTPSTTVPPVTTTGEMVTKQESNSGDPKIITGSTDQPPNSVKPTSKTNPPAPTAPSAEREREAELEKFKDCYAVNYESTCPPVQAFGISWPRSNPGPVKVQCKHGNAMWHCSRSPVVCWRRKPNVQQCTSPAVQNLTRQSESFLEDPGNEEATLAFTESLATAGGNPAMSEQDLYQMTVLLETAGRAQPNNASQAKTIIKDVLKCGSGLVANDKKSTWAGMEPASQRIVAAFLMRFLENVTLVMAETFTEPGVQTIENENIAIEVHVLSMANTLPGEGNVKFQREDNSFYIPEENILAHSSGGISRAIFLEYRTFGRLLKPHEPVDVTSERRVASRMLSATLGGREGQVQLTEPVIIAFKTEKVDGVERYQHKCSFWNYSLGFSGSWSQKGCALDKTNDTHTLCRCDHLTSFAVLMDIHKTEIKGVHAVVLSYITYTGIFISVICCFFSWLTFVCHSCRCINGHRSSADERGNSGGSNYAGSASRSVNGERNSIHKHLVFTIFVAEILFLVGIQRTDDKIACAVIAGVLHFFFTSSFFWMLLEGIHILFMLVQVFDAARSRVKYYYLVGYGFPLLIVGISALVYHDGYGTEKYCWLTSDRMFLWSFAGPVAFVLLVNLLILIYAMTAVCKHSEYVFTKEKSPTGNIRAWIQGALALEVLLGLTWVFGYFYISEEALPFAYLFTIFNSLQGLFIFVFHCVLNKKIRKEFQRFIDYTRRPTSSGTHSTKANASGHSSGLQLHLRPEPGFSDDSKTANGKDHRTSTDA